MHKSISLVALGIALLTILGACKTGQKKNDGQGSDLYGGVFDNDGRVNIKVPQDLKGFVPPNGARTDSNSSPEILSGLSLSAAPQSTDGIEEIISKCFRNDSQFIAEGWYFYAELRSSGKVIKDYNSREVNRCNEMQLELKTLERNSNYEVVASFYWQSKDKKTTIVWYEGKTKVFKPSDRNINLVLQKLRVDQIVDVDIELGEKDRCIKKKYLWNGKRCLDGFNSISFTHADLSDYSHEAKVAGSRQRKCLQIGDQGFAVQYDCHYKNTQLVKTKLHGSQDLNKDLPPTEYGWFTMQFESGEMCLQVQADPAGQEPYLVPMPCDTEIPRSDQLFTLVETTVGDAGARNSFRIMNQNDGTARCVSIPPEKGDLTGVQPLRNGAPVRLTPCATNNPNVRKSQFVRFNLTED